MDTVTRIPRNLHVLAIALSASLAAAAGASDLGLRADSDVTRTSRPVRLLRSWEETVKIGNREYPRRVQIVFDYANGWAREDSFDTRGKLVSSRRIVHGLPSPSAEELAEAFEIVRTDPKLGSIFSRFGVALDGGFVLEEETGMPCGPGSRCLQVLLMSSDRAGVIRRVVVDLVPRSLAYSVYLPDFHEGHTR